MSSAKSTTAILITDWIDDSELDSHRETPHILLPLLGKPLLQRAIESLVQGGSNFIHVLLGNNASKVRAFLGKGERWGVTLLYHYRSSDQTLGGELKRLGLQHDSYYRLAHADRLPGLVPFDQVEWNRAIVWTEKKSVHWSGWGDFTGAWLTASAARSFSMLEQSVLADQKIDKVSSCLRLCVKTKRAVLESAHRLLDEQNGIIQMGKNCRIHPSARIEGPCYVGNFVRIGADVHLGPYSIVEDGSLIDQRCAVGNSLILPDTYVGEDLDVYQAVVAQGSYYSSTHDAELTQLAPTVLAGVSESLAATCQRMSVRMGILLLQLLLWPLYSIARLLVSDAGQALSVEIPIVGGGAVKLGVANTRWVPLSIQNGQWIGHFAKTFYPGLRYVSRGWLAFVGLELVDISIIRRLPAQAQAMYRGNRAGLINGSLFLREDMEHEQSGFSVDAYAAVQSSTLAKLKLLTAYLRRVCQDISRSLFARLSH